MAFFFNAKEQYPLTPKLPPIGIMFIINAVKIVTSLKSKYFNDADECSLDLPVCQNTVVQGDNTRMFTSKDRHYPLQYARLLTSYLTPSSLGMGGGGGWELKNKTKHDSTDSH